MDKITKTVKIEKWQYIVVFIMLFVSDDTVLFGTNKESVFSMMPYVFCLLLLGILYIYILVKKIKIDRGSLFVVLLFSFLLVLTSVINKDNTLGYYYKIMIFGVSLLVISVISSETFFTCFANIMQWLTIVSLIMFFSDLWHFSFLHNLPMVTNTAENTFYSIGLANVPVSSGGFVRNWGCFREPGIFQIFLNFALLMELFYFKKINVRRCLILFFGVLTTFSTAGYSVTIVELIAFFLNKTDSVENKAAKQYIFIFCALAFLYLIFFTDLLFSSSSFGSVFGKIMHESSSADARWASITVNWKLFKENIAFGAGISNVDKLFPLYSLYQYGTLIRHNTNNLFIHLSMFGIFYSALFVYMHMKFTKFFSGRLFLKLLILIAIFMMYMGEKLVYSLFFCAMLLYAFKQERETEE